MITSTELTKHIKESNKKRVQSLDGIRGLAILLVVLFHAYSRWPQLTWLKPYSDIFIFKNGFLGVQLFFLLSGYVIYMTLERCNSFIEFAWRRWLRLFPAMLFCSIAIFISAIFLTNRPHGVPNVQSFFPGLFFLEPWVFDKFFNLKIKPLEGVFWSLYVEVKFYFCFGVLYFFNKKNALLNFILAILFYKFAVDLANIFELAKLEKITHSINHIFSIAHFGWFAIGAIIYKQTKDQNINLFYSMLMLVPISYCMSPGFIKMNLPTFVLVSILFLVFLLSVSENPLSKILSNKFLVFFGYVSYPLYLIHENALVSLTFLMRDNFPSVPAYLTPLPAILVLTLIAYLIAKYIEPRIKNQLSRIEAIKK